jgi:hypothetical protein
MRLVFDHNPGAYAVSVQCLACGRMVRLCDALIDAEGPAFRAYYHRACLPTGTPLPTSCDKRDCAKEHA